MNRRTKKTLLILGLVLGSIVLFNLIRAGMIKWFFAHYAMPAVTVSSAQAEVKDWVPKISAVGHFVAIKGVDVNAETSGNVVDIHFKSGQSVEKNALLADIDDHVAQANLKFNQAELSLQEINYKRQVDLYRRGATSGVSLDEAKAKWQQAEAKVEETMALIQQKHIRAPFAGRLGIRQINLGEYITPGKAFVTLQALDPLFLEFYLPEQMLNRVYLQQPVTFSVEQYPHLRFQGQINAISPKADQSSHNIQIQALVPNCSVDTLTPEMLAKQTTLDIPCNTHDNQKNNVQRLSFIPGMFAAIKLAEQAIPHAVVIPSTAISYTLYGSSVFVIDLEPASQKNVNEPLKGVVKQVYITTGEEEGEFTRVLTGLKGGETIVSVGEMKLQNGTHVVIKNDVLGSSK